MCIVITVFEILYSIILACTAIYSGMNCFFLCPYPIFGVECYLIMADTFFKIDIAIYCLTLKYAYEFSYVGCVPGYNGVNCSLPCPYPFYGVECQSVVTVPKICVMGRQAV